MTDVEATRCVLAGGLEVERVASVIPGVDLWWMPVRELSADWLSQEERERMGRFRHVEDRQAFVAKRVLVRGVLSTYEPVAPTDWRFVLNDFGKPQALDPTMAFSLARSGALVVCAVSRAGALGVDVEDLRRPLEEMPEWVLAPGEAAALRELSGDARREAFLGFWTLKEALVKALGCGLSLPIDRVRFQLGSEITVNVPDEWAIGTGWTFTRLRIEGRYGVAVACS